MRSLRDRSNIRHAIRDEKGLRYWLIGLREKLGGDDRKFVYDRRHICKDCVQIFSGLQQNGNE